MTDVKPSIQKGIYRHYKGNLYQVIDVVRHSETLDWLVLYHPLSLVAQQVAEALSKVETVTTQRTQTITLAANVSATQ